MYAEIFHATCVWIVLHGGTLHETSVMQQASQCNPAFTANCSAPWFALKEKKVNLTYT